MSTYLLTWNPNKGTGDGVAKLAERIKQGKGIKAWDWSTGTTKRIQKSDRVFFLRQGREPRGICGSGWVTRGWYTQPHWDTGKPGRANYVDFKFDKLVNPEVDPILTLDRLKRNRILAKLNWATPASGITVPDLIAAELERVWAIQSAPASSNNGDEDDELEGEDVGQFEGDLQTLLVVHRRREQSLRREKIAAVIRAGIGRLVCEVPGCGFDFEKTYGHFGKGYAQVHHLKPLGHAEGRVKTKLSDLAIVCANCHVMIHHRGRCRRMVELIQG